MDCVIARLVTANEVLLNPTHVGIMNPVALTSVMPTTGFMIKHPNINSSYLMLFSVGTAYLAVLMHFTKTTACLAQKLGAKFVIFNTSSLF